MSRLCSKRIDYSVHRQTHGIQTVSIGNENAAAEITQQYINSIHGLNRKS